MRLPAVNSGVLYHKDFEECRAKFGDYGLKLPSPMRLVGDRVVIYPPYLKVSDGDIVIRFSLKEKNATGNTSRPTPT